MTLFFTKHYDIWIIISDLGANKELQENVWQTTLGS
jgi:hypothetical protein